MSSVWGERLKISLFGESHGAGIGVVIDGLPAGEKIDLEEVAFQMSRRAPGRDKTSTQRTEADEPEILSGMYYNSTNGAPLCAIIRNNNTHSGDYDKLSRIPRPGHADYTAGVRYGGHSDFRGGGHFSGRFTAPLNFAGAVCRQILARRGVGIGAHLLKVSDVADRAFDPVELKPDYLSGLSKSLLSQSIFPVLDPAAGDRMRAAIEAARLDGDSVGGIVECAAAGLPPGLGDPIFGGIESRLSSIVFGIPAVKGLEFGAGFAAAGLRGSENNDPFFYEDGAVKTVTNNHGGILGGLTSGMPLIFRVAFKPTPSIFKTQQSVDLAAGEGASLAVHGRHDPCVAVRAVPVVEAAAAVCLLDIFLEAYGYDIG
jgi:chorismate synthase